MKTDTKTCQHEDFESSFKVTRLTDYEGGPATQYQADVRIRCAVCGLPFRFLGLPAGVDLYGAAATADGEEGRFAILPRQRKGKK